MKVSEAIRLALLPAAVCTSFGALAQTAPNPTTPIQHVIVLFQENESFDHYFGTYPNAQNNAGEQPFTAYPGTPSVNGLSPELLYNNPNFNAAGTARVNPMRLSPAQAYTCSQSHNYGPEQEAEDSGFMDKFPASTGRTTSEGCASDGSTVLGYYDGNTIAALWNYAQNYTLNDNSFGSTFGPSSTGAINLISGQTYGGTVFFGTGSTASYPSTVGGPVTDIGDFDPYLDDCGADQGGTVTTTSTLQMSGNNIGDLMNKANVTWGWFEGGFAPTTPAVLNSSGGTVTPAVCGQQRTVHEYPSVNPTVVVPNPVAPLLTGADIHTSLADYTAHHEPFMFYASTRNPHHLPPTSVAAIGTTDQANHQYDTINFFQALNAGNLPAVSFVKAPSAYNAHPGNSDPIVEQYWLSQIINQIMQSPQWPNTAIIIAYDDSDGWYDHVMAPVVSQSNVAGSGSTASVFDNIGGIGNCGTPVAGAYPARCGHGPRLPLLVISPYANMNYVDHTLTDQTSIINFVEANWNLGYIDGPTTPARGTASFDRYAGTLNNMFNFTMPPNPAPLLLTCTGAVANSASQACPLDPNL